MPHSLKSKIKSLCYKGEITEKERDRIIKALEQTELNPSYNSIKSELKPCEDCISREVVLGVIEELPNANPSYWNTCDVIDRADLIYVMERLEPVTPQQTCEDCISRTKLLSRIDAERKHLLDLKMDGAEHIIVHHARRIIEDMPSVTPKPCEEENPNCTECRYYDHEKHYCPRFCKVIEETMAEITSGQPRWIPCSERLPEENIHVLCQFYMGGMAECYHAHDYWHIVGGFRIKIDDVIAWMPLPEPYKAESEDKE